jgi:DNA-directed RNA polymerase subunit H (RpoH/RPB5)
LYKSIESEESYKNNTLDEVILIVGDIFETKKNLLEVVKAEQQKEIRGPDFAGRAPVYNLMYFRNLVSCIPEYIGVPEHIIMTPAESQEFLESQLKNPKELPLIPHTDPQILWIGGRQGQLVKIIRDSDTTGKTIIIKTIT